MGHETDRFGRYHIRRTLGRGGMCHIALAELRGPRGFRKQLALKRLHRPLLGREDVHRLFESEARVCGLLQHSNIVHAYEYGWHDDEPFLALELVEGVSLRHLVHGLRAERRRVGLGAALWIARSVAAALSYAHSLSDLEGRPLGLVHRDVSSSNILLSWRGEVKLADFGVARHAHSTIKSVPGTVRGRFAYMAPEQAVGRQVDHRADLFSLGVLMYECLTGVRPFDGVTDIETLRQAQAGGPRPLVELRRRVPARLRALVEACLEPDPDLRPEDASKIEHHLQAIAIQLGAPADSLALTRELRFLRW